MSLGAAATEAHVPRTCPPREKPPQREPHAQQLESSLYSPQLEKVLVQQ